MNIAGIPDQRLTRAAWELAWTQKLAEMYSMIPSWSRIGNSPALNVMPSNEHDLYSTLHLRDKVCDLQRRIATSIDLSTNVNDRNNFDAEWTALLREDRKKLILDGIYHVCRSFEMDTNRLWCPDVTVEALEADGGNGFLKMLKLVLPASTVPQSSDEIRVVPHLAVDQLLTASPAAGGNQGANADYWINYIKVERMLFISLIIHNTILGFVSARGFGFGYCVMSLTANNSILSMGDL